MTDEVKEIEALRVALVRAHVLLGDIRQTLINELEGPARRAFWIAVDGEKIAATALTKLQGN